MNRFKFKYDHVMTCHGVKKAPKWVKSWFWGSFGPLCGVITRSIFIRFLKLERFWKEGIITYNLTSKFFLSDEIPNLGVFGPQTWTPISQWNMKIGGSNKDQLKGLEKFFPIMPKVPKIIVHFLASPCP